MRNDGAFIALYKDLTPSLHRATTLIETNVRPEYVFPTYTYTIAITLPYSCRQVSAVLCFLISIILLTLNVFG